MYTVRGGKPETVLILRVTQTSACLPPNSMLTVLLQQRNPIGSDFFFLFLPKEQSLCFSLCSHEITIDQNSQQILVVVFLFCEKNSAKNILY